MIVPRADLFRLLRVLALLTLIMSLATCGEDPQSPGGSRTTQSRCASDWDCDGISDVVDRREVIADVPDVDNDGIANGYDISPYGPPTLPTIRTPPSVGTTPGPTTGAAYPCVRGLRPDGDADGIPDWCDLQFDQYNKDSDRDGLPDVHDPYSTNPDSDSDGLLDGQDPWPSISRYRERERLEQQRAEERLEEQRRQQELDARRRQEAEQYNDRYGY
jgi:Thrombospondin type 3 repeat